MIDLCRIANRAYDEQTGSVRELEYLVVEREHDTVFAVRGTEAEKFFSGAGFVDFIRDLRFTPWYNKTTGWCHAGFLKGAMKMVKVIEGMDIEKRRSLKLTGHSLGAVVTLLATHILFEKGYNVEWVGFGCPKTYIGKRYIPFKATAFVNGSDEVPTWPKGWVFDYRLNVVDVRHINPNGKGLNYEDHGRDRYLTSLIFSSENETKG